MATIESLPSTFDGVTANFQFDKGMRVSSVEEYAECSMPTKDVSFDPARHLSHIPPSKVHTMKELEYPESRGVSQVGVSEPFPLFSTEAIQHMRREIFSDEVLSKYQFSSNLAPCQLRGFAQECAPFVYDAWKNPKTLEIISKIAGVDLLPVMDYEIGHVNISVNNKEKPSECLEGTAETTTHSFAKVGCRKVDRPVVGWHTDSYPFVCVTMLSDCKGMVGGETALKRGDGGILNVRGPQMGWAVILQGRYIEHKALPALGSTERTTMVCSFRPRSSIMKDDTVLTTVRPVSDLGELYHQFAEYRFEILQDRFRDANKYMRDQKRAKRWFDTLSLKQFIRDQIEFLEHMDREIVEDAKVKKGAIEEMSSASFGVSARI